MAAKYPGRVTFVSENFGASKLAERYGVKGYPAVFVDDVLVAVPRDFGYFGEVEGTGRYAPWRNAENQARFKADLVRMIDLILAGKKEVVRREHATTGGTHELSTIPGFNLTDLSGRPLTSEQFAGRVVLVEFWATWCPPCRSTLQWLGELTQRYRDRVAVVAFAVESPQEQVRSMASVLSPDLKWAITDAPTAAAFGNITSVPTMFIFDRSGKTAHVLYGAPPDLHEQAESTLRRLIR